MPITIREGSAKTGLQQMQSYIPQYVFNYGSSSEAAQQAHETYQAVTGVRSMPPTITMPSVSDKIKSAALTNILASQTGKNDMPLPLAAIGSALAGAAPSIIGGISSLAQTSLGGASQAGTYVKYSALSPDQQKIWKAGFKRGIRLGRRTARRSYRPYRRY